MNAAYIAHALGDVRREWSCPTCAAPINDRFAAAYRDADARAQNAPITPKLALLRSLLDDRVSLDRTWRELNYTHARPVIDAILYRMRKRGLAALEEHPNIARLSRCDAAARDEINRRIAALSSEQDAT